MDTLPSTPLPTDVDILVVGFGPVGATAANLLGRYGLRVLVVDTATDVLTMPRAIVLDNEALRILQLAGVQECDFDKVAIPRIRMTCPFVGEFARINMADNIDGHPKLVTFYQPDLERSLRKRLEQYDDVHAGLGVTLTAFVQHDKLVVASLIDRAGETHAVRSRYLIGADGASSLVRRLIGQEFRGRTFEQDWLIVDTLRSPQPIDHVEFICDYRRPGPHMPAPGGRERWEFMLKRGETREDMEHDDTVRALLAPWFAGEEIAIERQAVYRFHARTAGAFSSGRVFLIGDAAHVTPPFAGQGLSSGLRDVANLCWKLAWVLKHGASSRILESYDVERRPHVNAMIRLARFIGALVMPRNAMAALVTHGLMRLARSIPPLREYFEELGIKPTNALRNGLFVKGQSAPHLRRGAVLPQGLLRDVRGNIRLSDDVLGPGLALIGFGLCPRSALSPETEHAFTQAGGTIVQIAHRGQHDHLSADYVHEDLEDIFLPKTAPFAWAAVVRPDKTIIVEGPSIEADYLVREALELLGIPTADPIPAMNALTHSA